MYILESKAQLEKAIAKAMKVRTSVKFIKFGVYSVSGSKGNNFYTVECKRIGNQKIVECNCKGGLANLVCFHSVSALSLHIYLARQRQTI
jgi:hypothetical protein